MPIIRTIGREYLTDAVRLGKILVSTLERCTQLDDLKRRDVGEQARVITTTLTNDDTCRVGIKFNDVDGVPVDEVGYYSEIKSKNIFVMSCSQVDSIESLADDVKSASFVITNEQRLGDIIGEALNDLHGVGMDIQGPCFYPQRLTDLDVEIACKLSVMPITAFFLKDVEFRHENEFRYLWLPYFNGSAVLHCKKRIRKYGYKFIEEVSHWPPQLLPPDNTTIPSYAIIEDMRICECICAI
jgi:tetrahydromethanopterin S-methyltransferase subunit F